MSTAIALVSVITSGLLGLGGLLAGVWGGRADRKARRAEREYDRKTAHAQRIEERRAEVYVELIAYLERDLYRAENIYAESPTPTVPSEMSDDEWVLMQARVSAFSSPEVAKLVREYSAVAVELGQAWQALDMLTSAGIKGDDYARNYEKLDAARKKQRKELLPKIVARIQKELGEA